MTGYHASSGTKLPFSFPPLLGHFNLRAEMTAWGRKQALQRLKRKAMCSGCMHQPWRNEIIKIMVLLHSAIGVDWQSPPKGTSLKTLSEAEEQGFIVVRGEFQKRQFRLTELGFKHVEHDKRRLEARKL